MPAEFGTQRRYRLRNLKHKFIWLLHDIMATHAARFPNTGSMFELRMKDNDVQPVLDILRDLKAQDDVVAATYSAMPIPLAAVAAMSHKPVIALAEQLVAAGTNLRTCVGALDEREEAAAFVCKARGKGAVLDTLTVWQLREFGHLRAAKTYFGRLCIPRSTFDEMIEIRAKLEGSRGREYMTMGFKGDQAWREVHSPEETEARITAINAVIADLETFCEILPVDGEKDMRLQKLMEGFGAGEVFDPIHLAISEGLILLSEDLDLRRYAARYGVTGGAWLQIILNVMAAENFISEAAYVRAVGILGAMRHDHLWLDGVVLRRLLTLEDPLSFRLFEEAIHFMGGPNADLISHTTVALDFMCGVWMTKLPVWQQGRAIGRLLDQFVRSRPRDWKIVVHTLDVALRRLGAAGDLQARRAHAYLEDWLRGHFYNIVEIRSAERLREALRPRQSARLAQPRKQNKRRRRESRLAASQG